MDDNFNSSLLKSIKYSISKRKFSSSDFFLDWFKKNGLSYFFLFKKNLKVTNIQFAELISLLRTYIYTKDGASVHNQLQFVSQSQFKSTVQNIIDSLILNKRATNIDYNFFLELYSDLLSKTVVIDVFFGSCAVYIPTNLTINSALICSESGYIHSCGKNVFIRNMLKASYEELTDAIDHHLKVYSNKKKLFFSVYAHEDFTQYDREIQSELKGGLDDSKIFLEKVDLGSERLVTILRKMKKKYKDILEIPDPGNFKTVHKEFRSHKNVDSKRTLWMITDRSLGNQLSQPGQIDYFIVYEQEYLNENPFHIFDENKPAWLDHTTIPHTLVGAMINITRPWKKKNIIINDPFVGSGTVYLESLKFNSIVSKCSDLNPFSRLITKDNLIFFSLSSAELKIYLNNISSLIEYLITIHSTPATTSEKLSKDLLLSYTWLNEFLFTLFNGKSNLIYDNGVYKKKHIDNLLSRKFFDRFLFYIALRTWKRNLAAFERESKDWINAYKYELSSLKNQIEDLCNLREKENNGELTELGSCKVVIQGSYSSSTTLGFHKIKQIVKQSDRNIVRKDDVRNIKPNSCDLIITDPPYGFNTTDNVDDLAKLYKEMIETLIVSLKKDGHLVFCLPYHSRTGRRIKFFTDYGLIIHQVLATAESLNREVINSAFAVPSPNILFRPPFYWESERALRRSILHFRFK